MTGRRWISGMLSALAVSTVGAAGARADVAVGDQAPLFQTVDESLQPVDMADLIDGRPLVLAVGSAS